MFFILAAVTTLSCHGTLAFAFPTSLATLKKVTRKNENAVSLKVMSRGYSRDGHWDDRPWAEEPRYGTEVDYDCYEDEWEQDSEYDRRPHRQTYQRREYDVEWEPDEGYDSRPRPPPRPAPRNNRRDFERAPQWPRRRSSSSPDYPPLPPVARRQVGDYNGRAPHNQDIRRAVPQDRYRKEAAHRPRQPPRPVDYDRDGARSSFADESSWERWGDSRPAQPQFEYGKYHRQDFNYWPPGRNDLEQRRQVNDYDRNRSSRRNGSRYLYPSKPKRSDRRDTKKSSRMGFGYGGIKRFVDRVLGYESVGLQDPMTKRIDSEINESIVKEQRSTKALLLDARDCLLSDPEVIRIVGDPSSIGLGTPYSQNSSKTTVNGVTRSRLEIVVPVAGSRATGRVLLVADQEELTSLEVEVGGRVVGVPLDGYGRLEDVVDVNVVDKTTYL